MTTEKTDIANTSESVPSGERRFSEENRPEPPGVGEWLALLIVILILAQPVVEAIFQSAVFNRQWWEDPSVLHGTIWNRYRQIVWTVCFIMSALNVSAGVVLSLENPPVRRRQVCHRRPVDYLARLLCRHHVRVAVFRPSGTGHRSHRAEPGEPAHVLYRATVLDNLPP